MTIPEPINEKMSLNCCMEKEYSISLPNQYKGFLCKYNGGYTPKTDFKAKKISSDIRGFYGLGDVQLSFSAIELRPSLSIVKVRK